MLGNNPPPTTFLPLRLEATLLNTQHPASCSSSIAAWQLCYYTSDSAIERGGEERAYRATIGVWRRSGSSNGAYFRVNGSEHEVSLSLQRQQDPEPALTCLTRRLQVPLFVRGGDIVGVSVPAERPVPLFADGAGSGNNSLQVLSSGQSHNRSLSLHVYAIVGVGSPQANAATTAIVVITLVAVAVAVAAIVLLVCCWWKRKRATLVLHGIHKRAENGETIARSKHHTELPW